MSVADMLATCDGLTEQEALEYLEVRKSKRARLLTLTAWKAIEREAAKVGYTFADAVRKCIERNWIGFEAEWIQGSARRGPVDFAEKRKAEAQDFWNGVGFDEAIPVDGQVIDVAAERVTHA